MELRKSTRRLGAATSLTVGPMKWTKKATVAHIPSVSLLPNLIHGRQCRSIELQGDRLVLRAAGAPVAGGLNVISRLEWKRITSKGAPSI